MAIFKDISDYLRGGKVDAQKLGKTATGAVQNFRKSQKVQGTNFLPQLLLDQESIMKAKAKKIVFSDPILSREETPILFPRTINVIQGKAGVHKSRLAEIICATLLAKNERNANQIGLERSSESDPWAVSYVDTERNLADQFPYCLQQIQKRAGYAIDESPEEFMFVSLLNIDRQARFAALEEYLSYIREETDKHILIILDVITDCIASFNDAQESLSLIDLLNRFMNNYSVTFLCLVHENPGRGEKARGHLGTELMNKATTVIQVAFEKDGSGNETELIRIKFLKIRNARRPAPFHVLYDEEHSDLVLADPEKVSHVNNSRKQKANLQEIVEELSIALENPKLKTELKDELAIQYSCTPETVHKRLNDLINADAIILNNSSKGCRLHEYSKDKKKWIELRPIDDHQ